MIEEIVVRYKPSYITIDPRTKIFLMVTVTSIMATGSSHGAMFYLRHLLMVLPFIALFISKKGKAAIRFLILYLIIFALNFVVLPYTTGFLSFLVLATVGIYTNILPGFIMGYYLISTTSVSEFIAAMEKLKVSYKIIIPFSVVFRFFPTVKEEYISIQNAMKIKGVTIRKSPIEMIEYRLVPLLISVTKIGEELSASALTRGLGSPIKRTNICKIGLKKIDYFLLLLANLCWVVFIFF